MNRWFNTPDNDKQTAYNQVYDKTNLPAYAVEKDWWVVQTLSILFELEIGPHLVFKGGTSLSKAWNLIERFSEDIDLAVDRTFFGYDGELGKSKRTKLRKESKVYITDILYPALEEAFKAKGISEISIELEEIKTSDQDPIIIRIFYPNVIQSPGYIQPSVQIEIGCRSLREPFEKRSIISMLDNVFSDLPFSQAPILIPSVLPERTFLEKIFLLHEEFQRSEEKIRVDRLSRHLYDIHQISKTEYAYRALSNKGLYETIVKHRKSFTKLGGVDYNLHKPQTINFIPPTGFIAAWKEDYKTMKEQMIYGNSPNFDELILSLKELKHKINNTEWTLESRL